MPKYLSGRVKRTPQNKLTDDRYKYLSLEQAEPNIGDPPTASGTPGIPAGQQYQLVSVLSNPGERYWIPIGGGLIPGSISVYDEGSLVGSVSSITQLNFIGVGLTADAALLGVGATITVTPPGDVGSVLFKERIFDPKGNSGVGTHRNDFNTSSDLVFNSAVGILTVGNGINIGIGGTIITAFSGASGIASVGIGTAAPSQELDVNGDVRIRKTIYDWNNEPGDQGELLAKGQYGLEWTNASAVRSGAGGDIGQLQYHNTAGLVDGADLFYYDATNDRVGIGSTQPTSLLDVIGLSTFRGGVTVDHLYITGVTTALNLIDAQGGVKANTLQVTDLTNDRVVYVGPNGELVDSTNLTFDDYTLRPLGANVVGTTTSANLKVTGISTIGNVVFDTNEIRTSTGNLTLDAYSDTVQVNAGIYLNFATESHTKDSGALIVEGGVGIEKNLNVGGAVSFTGPSSGIGVTLSAAGGITTTGGDLYVGGDLHVKNDTVLSDGIFEQLLVNPGVGTFKGDLELWGNGSSSKDAFWDKGNTQFVFNNDIDLKFGTLQDFSIYFDDSNKCATLKIKNNTANNGIIKVLGPTDALVTEFNALGSVDLYYNGTTNPGIKFQTSGIGVTVTGQLDAATGNFSSNLTVDGVSNLNGDINLGDATTDNIDFKGKVDSDIIPNIPNENDLGSAANRWDVVYANTFDGLGTLTVDDLYVSGIATFKDDVEFHGTGGTDSKGNVGIKSAFWDKSEMRFRYLDNIEASWGDNRELQIYHFDDSYIKNTADTSNLYIESALGIYLRTKGGTETALRALTDAGVDLYYDGGLRLSTYDKGISLSADGSVGAGVSIFDANNSNYLSIKSPDNLASNYTLTLPPDDGDANDLLKTDGNGVLTWGASGNLNVDSARKVGVGSTNQNDTYHFTFVKDNNPHTNRQNEHLYSDAKITYKFNETTSIGNFGINVDNPSALLDLYHAKDNNNWRFRINTDVSNGAGFYQKADGNFEMVLYDKTDRNNYILGDGGSLSFITNADPNSQGTERFRMGPNGQLGIAGANYGTAGYVLKSQGPNDPVVWAVDSSGGTTPGGEDTEVQYNNNGAFDGIAELTYNNTTGDITFGGDSKNAVWDKSDNALEFQDDAKLKFGTTSDKLSLYSTTENFIENNVKLNIKIKDELSIQTTSGENVIKAIEDGAVTLYNNSFSKLATTTDGIKIYGGIQDKTDSLGADTQLLSSTGTELLWVNAGSVGGEPGGDDRQIQYNNNGSFGGTSTFIFDDNGSYYHGINNSIYFLGTNIDKNVSWQSNNNAFVFMNDTAINLGTAGNNNNDWQSRIYHDGNASYWDALQGGKDINIQGSTSNTSTQTFRINPNKNKDSIVATANAEVSLHHDGTKRIETTNDGIRIYGGLQDKDGQLGTSGQLLTSTGTGIDWVNAGSVDIQPGGTDKQVQFNDGGSTLAGAANLLFDKTATAPTLILSPSNTSTSTNGGYIEAQNANDSNYARISSDGGIELKRTNESAAGGGSYVDFKYNASDMDARIQMDIVSGTTSDGNFSAITFLTGGGNLAANGGSVEERLRIGKAGEIGIDAKGSGRTSAQIYGTIGQVLKSGGFGASVYWDNDSGGGGGLTDITVDYTGRNAPCAMPITITTPSSGTKQINIPQSSNAFGAKYVQTAEPTGNTVCDGDIWYDTTPSSSSGNVGGNVPVGGIIMYSGTDTELNALTNWKLCDGTNGTPNLKDKFIIGADQYSSGWKTNVTGSLTDSGGSKDAVVVQHNHDIGNWGGTFGGTSGATVFRSDSSGTNTTIIQDEGVSGTNKNLPPYYALAYIMRIS